MFYSIHGQSDHPMGNICNLSWGKNIIQSLLGKVVIASHGQRVYQTERVCRGQFQFR